MNTRSRVFRACLVALTTALLASVILVFSAASASASCTPSSHCWALAHWKPAPTNHGGKVGIHVDCLKNDDPDSHFDTAELWVGTNASPDGSYWVEEGMMNGALTSTFHGRQWFWADNRPNGGGFNRHFDTGWPHALDTTYVAKIIWNGNDSWLVQQDGNTIGTSTANPGNSKYMDAGLEANYDDTYVSANMLNLGWKGTADEWNDGWDSVSEGHAIENTVGTNVTADWLNKFTAMHVERRPAGC